MSRNIVKTTGGTTAAVVPPRMGGVADGRFWRSPGMALSTLCFSAMGGVAGGGIMMLLVNALLDLVGAAVEPMTLWLLLGVVLTAVFYVPLASLHSTMAEDERLELARGRLIQFGHHRKAQPDEEKRNYAELFPPARVREDDEMRALILRIAAVLDRTEATLAETSTDPATVARTREVAGRAIDDLIRRHEAILATRAMETSAMARLEADCADIVSDDGNGAPPAPTAPTARIARIVRTAEKVLAERPDLVDDQGARVDDLVRRHVPRLLQRHAEAAATAPLEQVAAVDAELEKGIEDVRRSVESALELAHDEAMDELAKEIRFLALRRGAPPLLTSVG